MNEVLEHTITILYTKATCGQLNGFLEDIEKQLTFYPWESKLVRLNRFNQLEGSKRAILAELRSRK